jgi:DUF4097 and DUF4098 domain-containing protein YvlB
MIYSLRRLFITIATGIIVQLSVPLHGSATVISNINNGSSEIKVVSSTSSGEMMTLFPVNFPFSETSLDVVFSELDSYNQNSQTEPYQTTDFKVSGTPNITVKSINGSIQVHPGDTRTVRVELYVTRRGLAVLGTDRLGDDYRIVMRQRNDHITAEIISLKGGAFSTNTPSFNFIVYAPVNVNASLSTNNGDISITDIGGNIDIRSSSGNIQLANTRGTSRLSSTSGNIRVQSHTGTVFTNAIAGDVRYHDVSGECRIKVVSGNVTLDEIRGSTIVHTTNGNIELNTSLIDVLIDLETIVGNIKTSLPSNVALNFDVQGQRVNINAVSNFAGDIRRNSINGKLNGGGTPVRIKSAVGSIDIQLSQN